MTLNERFELLREIGSGGCATVWLARHRLTGALMAVKRSHEATELPELAARFQREAELSARLVHRNLIRVFDFFHEPDGSSVMVMEYLRGATLEDLLTRCGPLSPLAAVTVAIAIARGLEHVHSLGVVHRDLKPANIFLNIEPDGLIVPKLLDFGIAKSAEAGGIALTRHGEVLGTPAYMAPEQVRGDPVTPASDVFSVGVLLYELMTAELAFRAPSTKAAMLAVLSREVEQDPRIPDAVWTVLKRALQKTPAQRFASMPELAAALALAVGYSEFAGCKALSALDLGPQISLDSLARPSSVHPPATPVTPATPVHRATVVTPPGARSAAPRAALALPPKQPRKAADLSLAQTAIAMTSRLRFLAPPRLNKPRIAAAGALVLGVLASVAFAGAKLSGHATLAASPVVHRTSATPLPVPVPASQLVLADPQPAEETQEQSASVSKPSVEPSPVPSIAPKPKELGRRGPVEKETRVARDPGF